MKLNKIIFLVSFLFSISTISYAGIPVLDYSNLFQNIIKVIQGVKGYATQAKQAANTALIVANQYRQLANDTKTLGTLGESRYSLVIAALRSNIKELDEIMTEVEAIKYEYGQIESEYYALFPNGIENFNWDGYDFEDFENQVKRWNNAVMKNSAAAMKAQSGLNRLKDQSSYIESLMNESKACDGQVRQIQISNQLLGAVSDRLGEMHKTSATSARLNSILVSAEAQRNAAARERERRLRSGYTKKGEYKTTVLKALPTVY